jgi:predicted nucleic acid-binding protein
VEVVAALRKKQRTGELESEQVATLTAQFAADFHGTSGNPRKVRSIRVTREIISSAVALVSRHDLQAYDAVQLANALTVRAADPENTRFACFDTALAVAGEAEGLGRSTH